MGFSPKAEVDAHFVEYYKDYAEPHGRVARCSILFHKSGAMGGIDHARIAKFLVTVQGAVQPVIEQVLTTAPKVMHEDMLATLRVLEGLHEQPDPNAVWYTCSACHKTVSEFVLGATGNIVCRSCQKVTIHVDEQD